jgi:hypothetical protein
MKTLNSLILAAGLTATVTCFGQSVGIGTTTHPLKGVNIEAATGTQSGVDLNETSTGDPVIRYQLAGTNKFVMGIDNSQANDPFIIEYGGTLGTNNSFCADSDGNIGIGTGDATQRMHVYGGEAETALAIDNTNTANDAEVSFDSNVGIKFTFGLDGSVNDAFKIGTTALTTANYMRFEIDKCQVDIGSIDFRLGTGGALGGGLRMVRDDNTTDAAEMLGGFGFSSNDGAAGTSLLLASCAIIAEASEAYSTTAKGGRLLFYTSPIGRDDNVNASERMRIEPDGNVGIGTTVPSHLLHVNGLARATNANWATTSDIRVKENIQNLDNGLQTILMLNPVAFDWKDQYLKYQPGLKKHDMGFIAQEVKTVIPLMVSTIKESYGEKTIEDFHVINKGLLEPVMVKAIQEQQHLLDERQAMIIRRQEKINEMKADNAAIRQRIQNMEIKLE